MPRTAATITLMILISLTALLTLGCGSEAATDTPQPPETRQFTGPAGETASPEPSPTTGATSTITEASPTQAPTENALSPTVEPTTAVTQVDPTPTAYIPPTLEPRSSEPAIKLPTEAPPPVNGPMVEPGTYGEIQEVMRQLPPEEQTCIEGKFPDGEIWQDEQEHLPEDPETIRKFFGCLSNESIANVFIVSSLRDEGEISEETADCIIQGPTGGILRNIILAGDTQDNPEAMMGAMFAAMMSMTFFMADCLTDDEWDTMGVLPEERQMLSCINQNLSPEDMAGALRMDPETLTRIEEVSEKCQLQNTPSQGETPETPPTLQES